jgi:hypothetical protein
MNLETDPISPELLAAMQEAADKAARGLRDPESAPWRATGVNRLFSDSRLTPTARQR